METIAIFGASGGLGSGIAENLSRHYRLILGYHTNFDAVETLKKKIVTAGGSVETVAVDIRYPDSVAELLDRAEGTSSRFRGVVNAVGPEIPLRPLIDVSPGEFERIVKADVLGSFNVLTEAARRLGEMSGGAIVQLLTTAVLRTLENDGMSGIPKTAVMGIVRQLAREVAKDDVRVNAIAPGVIDAGIVHSSFKKDVVAQGVIELCLNRTPMPRLGHPSEVSSLVQYLLDDKAGYINGQIIGVDGGYSA